MKILALVPDPRAAYGLGAVLAALPRPSLRVVAFGQASAAALPPGLDVAVYPVREGTRLPGAFLDALLVHEGPDCLLAPVGAVTATPVPALLVDLDPFIAAEAALPLDEDGQVAWIEALTADAERRRALLRAGLFSVDLNPSLFDAPGRVGAHAASSVHARLADMASLGTRPAAPPAPAPFRRPAEPAPPASSPPPASNVRIVRVTSGERPDAGPAPGPDPANAHGTAPELFPAAPRAPLPFRPAAPDPAGEDVFEDLDAAPRFGRPAAPPAERTPFVPPRPPAPRGPRPVSSPRPGLLDPLDQMSARPAAGAPAPVPVPGRAPSPEFAPAAAAVPVQDAALYRDRCRGGGVIVLAGPVGLEALGPADLAHGTVIAVPDAIGWLNERMGVAQFVCAAAPPQPGSAAALAGTRTVLVHAEHVDGAAAAPRARARVVVNDLQRAGGPGLGWSDEMETGFFPGPGDVGLALQWASWLGPAEVLVAGLDPRDARPPWPAFVRAVQELFGARGIALTLGAGHAGPRSAQAPNARTAWPR